MKKIKYPVLAIALVFFAYCKSTKTSSPAAPAVAFTPDNRQLEMLEKTLAEQYDN